MKRGPAFLGGGRAAAPPETACDTAATWERETYLTLRRSKRRAWGVAAAASVLAFMAMLAVLLVLPLKEFAPYVVTVDKNTGWLEVTRGLHPGSLTQNEALTIANIVRCLTAYETFDATDYRQTYRYVGLCMAGPPLDAYRRLHNQNNPTSPPKVYGYDGIVRVEIRSVNLLSDTTALVSFRTIVEERGRETALHHWRGALTFGYTGREMSMADRFINPLGFQITSYRRDPDLLPTQE